MIAITMQFFLAVSRDQNVLLTQQGIPGDIYTFPYLHTCWGLIQRFPGKLKFRRLFLFTQNTLVFFKILKIFEGFPGEKKKKDSSPNKVYTALSVLGVY